MKKTLIIVLILLSLTSCTVKMANSNTQTTDIQNTLEIKSSNKNKTTILKGVWISCYELDFKDKTKIGFSTEINKMFNDVKSKGFNTIFIHVRSHSDAYYKSKYFPFSSFISKKQGINPGYDPLKIMCYFAKMYSLKIHAWINPLRVSTNKNIDYLSDNNPAKKHILSKDGVVKEVDNGYYFNPCYDSVRKLIVNGVKEIVENYDIDGIHFDDYFYPTTDKSFDKEEYKKSNSSLSLYDWRRQNIDKLIKEVYKVVKNENKIFGISPHCSFYYNYNTQYADIKKWCKNSGYIDYIAPQIYFGFEEKTKTPDGQSLAFKSCFNYWKKHSYKKPMYIGLALYRCGEKGEFSKNNIISRQIEYLNSEKSDGYIIFSYSYFNKNKLATDNAIKIIKAS